MGQFDKLMDEVKQKQKSNKSSEKNIKINLSKNPALNINYAKDMIINHTKDLSDKELYDFLSRSYSILLKDIFEKDDTSFLDVILDDRLLSQFIQVINDSNLTDLEVIYCNKIAYDYLVMNSKKSDFIKKLMLSMSRAVNRDKISMLHSIGLPDEIAVVVALTRYSNIKDKINIKRLNHLLMVYSADLITPQMAIYIFEKLFDTFTELFITTMYDVYSRETLHNMSQDSSEVYSNINLALVVMLEGLESSIIRKVLLMYANTYNVGSEYSDVRFPIKSLSISDFSRTLSVVEILEKSEMVIVP